MNCLPLKMTTTLFGLALATLLLSSCGSTPELPAQAIPHISEITQFDEQTNYIFAKNASSKLAGLNVKIANSAFMLGITDVMAGTASRIPAEDYNYLVATIRKNASPLTTTATVNLTKPELPSGLRLADERVSYMTARPIAQYFIKNGIPIITTTMAQALNDLSAGKSSPMTNAEEQAVIKTATEKVRYGRTDWTRNRDAYYKNEELLFFANNKKKTGVITLESGVQYLFLDKGTGKLPTASGSVRVHYRGSLLDGSLFDSSYERNNPALFPLSGLIKGFREALQYLPEGTKAIVYIPAELAYGDKGNPQIPPHAAIKFEIEIFSVSAN